MKASYSTKTSSVRLTLSWTEIRQFLSGAITKETQDLIREAAKLPKIEDTLPPDRNHGI